MIDKTNEELAKEAIAKMADRSYQRQTCFSAEKIIEDTYAAPMSELEDLREWRKGRKGIEDYYTVKYELTQAKNEVARLTQQLAVERGLREAARVKYLDGK